MGHILVVDDNEMNREVLSRRLEREGHTFALAEDGVEALQILHSGDFDLIMLDLMMPKVDGFQVLEQVKSDPDLKDIPVIMLSARNELESIYRAIELGAEDFLFKPFNAVLLRKRIERCLENRRLQNQQQAIEPGTPLAEALDLITESLKEPIEHSMKCVDQLLTKAAGPINDQQAELLGIVQSRLVQMVRSLIRNQ